MDTNSLSPYARRIVEESIRAMNNSDSAENDRAVRSVVSDLYVEVGPKRWEGTVNSALIEIVQSYVSEVVGRAAKPAR